MKSNCFLFLFCLTLGGLSLQDARAQVSYTFDNEAAVNDSIFFNTTLPAVYILSFKNPKDQAEFAKLRRNIMKVYPYVKMAGEIYQGILADLEGLDKRRQQNKYLSKRENQLREEFTEEIKHLSKTQGEILVLLVHRETGLTMYELLKELKSPTSAFFINTGAKIYGHNLKLVYDKDQYPLHEYIMQTLEAQGGVEYVKPDPSVFEKSKKKKSADTNSPKTAQ